MAHFKVIYVALLFASAIMAQDYSGTNYNTGDSGRSETVNPDGSVVGQYSYNDPNGKLITLRYKAGKDGFMVEGDHLPKAPVPQAPAAPQYQQQQQPQQYQQQYDNDGQYNPQHHQQYQYQPESQQPQQLNNFQQQGQQQRQQQLPASTFFQNQNFAQQHPNSIPQQQYNNFNLFQQQQQQPNNFPRQNDGNGHGRVSVSNQPGQGFSYTYQS